MTAPGDMAGGDKAGADRAGAGKAGGWTIRRATADDVPTLSGLLAEMSEELGVTAASRCGARALRRHGFGETPLFRALIAERRDHALGLSLYFPEFSTFRGRPGVYVQDLFVRPEARSTGLAREMLAATARDGAEGWDAAYLRLTAHETNPRALAFYARLGFGTDTGERPLWIDGGAFRRLGGME